MTSLALFFSTLIFGCSPKNTKDPNAVVIGISSIPATLDPRFALDSEGMKIGSLIFQSIIKIGPDMNVIGDAAENWTLKKESNNFLLKFILKKKLKFSHGIDVTCDDIIFSIEQYQAEDSPFKSAFTNITDIECKDQNLTLKLNEYSEKVLNSDLPVIKILPKKIIIEQNDNFKNLLIGSGAFKVSKLKETEINLEPNLYFEEIPKIKNLQFKVIKDDFTRFLKMYRGDLDLAVSSLPKNKIKSLETLDRLEVIKRPGLSMAYLLLNLKNKELQNFNHRKIIFEGIDRNEIIKYKLEGLAQPATSILTPANPYFLPEFLKINAESKNIDLEDLRKKVLNTELSKVVLNLKTSNTREAVENAKLIATQLRKIGLRINHESYEWGTYYKDIKQGEFDLATMTWVGAYDPDIYRIAFASTELPPEGRNRGYYSNVDLDRLVNLGAKELNSEKRKEIYYEVQKIIYKDLAIIPLWYEDTITVKDKRIRNYVPSLNGDYSGLIKASL